MKRRKYQKTNINWANPEQVAKYRRDYHAKYYVPAPSDPERIQKEQEVIDLFRSGKTYQEIGFILDMSKQGAHRIVHQKHKVDPLAGGSRLNSINKKQLLVELREQSCLERKGMSYKDYRILAKAGVGYKYATQVRNAALRNIPWEFNLASWWKVWQDSGHWEERGIGDGKYCMARKGDKGPYSPENVEIITHNQNSYDCRLNTFGHIRTPEESREAVNSYSRRYHAAKMKAGFRQKDINGVMRWVKIKVK